MKSIAIYCGSHVGHLPEYAEAGRQMGRVLAQQKLRLVYGGGKTGMMGIVADACIEAGGEVLGVIPRALFEAECANQSITELRVVEDMHQRKLEMMAEADGFIALPGGLGTLEELFEVFTWNQLGLLEKPCGILNVNGYYDQLLSFLDTSVAQGFLRTQHLEILQIDQDVEGLIERLRNYERRHPAKIAMGISDRLPDETQGKPMPTAAKI